MTAAVSIRRPNARDIDAMRRALGPSSRSIDPKWMRDALAHPAWLLADFVAIVLEHGGRCEVRSKADRFAAAMAHGAPFLRWFVPFNGLAYLDGDVVNRFFSERGGLQ